MPPIFRHYVQLLAHYRRLIFWIVGITTGSVALLSIILLIARPTYTASASVVMLPTDAQLTFTRDTVGGSRASFTLAETHIEYLRSTPVITEVLDQIMVEMPGEEEKQGLMARLAELATDTLGLVNKVVRILNSGTYVELDPRERAIQGLRQGTSVKTVPGSFILDIEVAIPFQEASAQAANSLADAYVRRTAAELQAAADEFEAFLQSEMDARIEALQAVIDREFELKGELGLLSQEQQSTFLTDAIEVEREKYADAAVEVEALQTRLDALRAQRSQLTRPALVAKVDQDMAAIVSDLDAMRRRQQLRLRSIEGFREALNALAANQQPLVALGNRREDLEGQLADLRGRLMDVGMTRSAAIATVRVVDPARVPPYPSFPRVLDNTVLAFIASLIGALFVIIGLDTLSGTVKTEGDLDRVTGSRGLPALTPTLISQAADPTADSGGKNAAAFDRFARRLDMELTLRAAFDGGTVGVTGFLATEALEDAAATLATALARPGRDVRCVVSDAARLDGARPWAGGGNVRFAAATAGGGEAAELTVESLGPLAGGFGWKQVAERKLPLVCVLEAATVDEDLVEQFADQARQHGAPSVSFLLLHK